MIRLHLPNALLALSPRSSGASSTTARPSIALRPLLSELATLTKNRCLAHGSRSDTAPFTILATPNPTQIRALNLINTIQV